MEVLAFEPTLPSCGICPNLIDMSLFHAARQKTFHTLVWLLRPLMPVLVRWPLAWRVRAAFFKQLRPEAWLKRYGPDWSAPLLTARNVAVLADVRGAPPEDRTRLADGLARQTQAPIVILTLDDEKDHRSLSKAIPETCLTREGGVLYIDAASHPHPLMVAHFAAAMDMSPEAALWYADEVQSGPDGKMKVFCKPAWDPLYFNYSGYVGNCFVLRGDLARRILDPGGSPVQKIPDFITPKTAPFVSEEKRQGGPAKNPLFVKALQHLQGEAIGHLPIPLRAAPAISLPPKAEEFNAAARALKILTTRPKVDIIIPFRDRLDLLRPCLESLLAVTDYPDWGVILVDNGSRDPDILAYLNSPPDRRIRVLRHDAPFNFSTLVNLGAKASLSEILVLLNNDITAISATWLQALVARVIQPQVGCVGAKLLYPNGLVQHAGILCGAGMKLDVYNPPGHAHAGWPGDSIGYFGLLNSPRIISAVTGAALAVSRDLFFQLGGFDENLTVALNDIDFCLKSWSAGRCCVWTPESVLVHHESASRKMDISDPQKRERLRQEWALMKSRWGDRLDEDPWYNPNLSTDSTYELSDPPRSRRPRLIKL